VPNIEASNLEVIRANGIFQLIQDSFDKKVWNEYYGETFTPAQIFFDSKYKLYTVNKIPLSNERDLK
jgi:hypothetical protein